MFAWFEWALSQLARLVDSKMVQVLIIDGAGSHQAAQPCLEIGGMQVDNLGYASPATVLFQVSRPAAVASRHLSATEEQSGSTCFRACACIPCQATLLKAHGLHVQRATVICTDAVLISGTWFAVRQVPCSPSPLILHPVHANAAAAAATATTAAACARWSAWHPSQHAPALQQPWATQQPQELLA